MTEVKKFFLANENRLNKGYVATDKAPEARESTNQSIVLDQQFSISPDLLRFYEEVKPGITDQLLSLAQKEQQHHHYLIQKQVKLQYRAVISGQICGLLSMLATCYAMSYLLVNVGITSAAIFTGGMLSLITLIYVYSRRGKANSTWVQNQK